MELGESLKNKDVITQDLELNKAWETQENNAADIKKAKVSTGAAPPPLVQIQGNALDSFVDRKGLVNPTSGVTAYVKHGKWYHNDGQLYNKGGDPNKNVIKFVPSEVPQELMSVITYGDPRALGLTVTESENGQTISGTIDFEEMAANVVDGETKSVKFKRNGKWSPAIDRETIEKYQQGFVGKNQARGVQQNTLFGQAARVKYPDPK